MLVISLKCIENVVIYFKYHVKVITSKIKLWSVVNFFTLLKFAIISIGIEPSLRIYEKNILNVIYTHAYIYLFFFNAKYSLIF